MYTITCNKLNLLQEVHNMNSTTFVFQAREAGMKVLPRWLYFNHTTMAFTGVPVDRDRGKVYVTLETYLQGKDKTSMVRQSIFSILVVSSASLPPNQNMLPMFQKSETPANLNILSNCTPNHHHSLANMYRYPYCPENNPPLMANLITLINFTLLDGSQRAGFFSTVSTRLGICPWRLVLNPVNWSSKEGMRLWKELAEAGLASHLDFSTIVSCQWIILNTLLRLPEIIFNGCSE